NMVGLTNAERERLKLWSLWPCDLDKGVIRIEKQGVAKLRNRQQMQAWRKQVRAARDMDLRAESLLMLIGKRWRSAAKLAAAIEGGRAWTTSNGQPLADATLRKAVHRVLDELSARKIIESKSGFALRRVRRIGAATRGTRGKGG